MSEPRAELLNAMAALAARGIDCNACVGTCCTFVANSMQVDEEEAELIAQAMDPALWEEAVTAAIARFGLDRPEVGDGRRHLTRRHYTCPFFRGGARGCAVPLDAKPLGCLAFNPKEGGQTAGGNCAHLDRAGALPLPAGARKPLPIAVLAAWQRSR